MGEGEVAAAVVVTRVGDGGVGDGYGGRLGWAVVVGWVMGGFGGVSGGGGGLC